jgi:hypothetical protein
VTQLANSERSARLRRGRGGGYREAIRVGKAATDDVVTCVVNDPRWDRQIESRDDYYARLLVELGGDVSPIVQRLIDEAPSADESDFWLPIGVLAQMALRGYAPAAKGLALAIRRGRRWRACLDGLEAAGGESLVSATVQASDIEALLSLAGAEDVADAARVVAAPWGIWASAVPALRFVSAARANRTEARKPFSGPVGWIAHRLRAPESPSLNSTMTTAELLDAATVPGPTTHIVDALLKRSDSVTDRALRLAATEGAPRQRAVALHVLGKLGCTDFVSAAVAFLTLESEHTSSPVPLRRAYIRYLEQLPADLTLSLAREWFASARPLSLAGEGILAARATRDDRILLETAGAIALEGGDMHRLCSVIDGLATICAVESVPFLSDVYGAAPYSFARTRTVKALVPHATRGPVQDLLVESLWDCESESRELACGSVSLTELSTRRRLAEVADDAFEEPDTRQAARARQKRAPGG